MRPPEALAQPLESAGARPMGLPIKVCRRIDHVDVIARGHEQARATGIQNKVVSARDVHHGGDDGVGPGIDNRHAAVVIIGHINPSAGGVDRNASRSIAHSDRRAHYDIAGRVDQRQGLVMCVRDIQQRRCSGDRCAKHEIACDGYAAQQQLAANPDQG
jgi:hypothetical protein